MNNNELQLPFNDSSHLTDASGGIILRAPELGDLSLLFNIENDTSLWHYGCNTGPYSRYQMEQFITQNSNDIYTDGQLRFMIAESNSPENVLGIADVFCFDARNSRAEVGIMILKKFRGKGIAVKSLEMLHKHCFGFLGMHQLYAYIVKENTPAIKLFESCGYTYSGTLDSWIRRGANYLDVCVYQLVNG